MENGNILLLGSSSFARIRGISKALAQRSTNLSLGSSTSIQSLYELLRPRNQQIIDAAKLIIVNSNLNEIYCNLNDGLSINFIFMSLSLFYQKLYELKKRVLVILVPYKHGAYRIINQFHLDFCQKYGFNYINMQAFYEERDLFEFSNRYDGVHQFDFIMRKLGSNIGQNLDLFAKPRRIRYKKIDLDLKICPAESMLSKTQLPFLNFRNILYREQVCKIDANTILYFPKHCYGYKILAIHTWNKELTRSMKVLAWKYNYSNILIQNQSHRILKPTNFANSVVELKNSDLIIDAHTRVTCGFKLRDYTELHAYTQNYHEEALEHESLNLVGFFLYKGEVKLQGGVLSRKNDAKYNFNCLIPPVHEYREIIDEYCKSMRMKITL